MDLEKRVGEGVSEPVFDKNQIFSSIFAYISIGAGFVGLKLLDNAYWAFSNNDYDVGVFHSVIGVGLSAFCALGYAMGKEEYDKEN